MDKQAVSGLARHNGHAEVAALQGAGLVVQPEPRLLPRRAMALIAVLSKNGLDVFDKIYARPLNRGEGNEHSKQG